MANDQEDQMGLDSLDYTPRPDTRFVLGPVDEDGYQLVRGLLQDGDGFLVMTGAADTIEVSRDYMPASNVGYFIEAYREAQTRHAEAERTGRHPFELAMEDAAEREQYERICF